MKKTTIILTAIVCIIAMVSCEPMTQQQRDADAKGHITEFTYKGHRYLLYKEEDINKAYGGITHAPDCPCHKNNK